MKKKLKFGFISQGYEAPRAESIELRNEGLLCASDGGVGGDTPQFDEESIIGTWDNP